MIRLVVFLVISGIAGYVGYYYMLSLYQEDLEELLDDSVFWGRLLPVNVLYFLVSIVLYLLPWEIVEVWIGNWFLYGKTMYVFITEVFRWPLLQQILLYVNFSLFRRLYGRDPCDTFWSMDVKLIWPDGIFNFVNGVLSFGIPMVATLGLRAAVGDLPISKY